MNDTLTVTVVHGRQDLFDQIGCVLFAKILLLCNSLEKFASMAHFCHEKETLRILEEFVQFDYIRMIQLLKNTDLR